MAKKIELTFHGAAQEVGGSCIEVRFPSGQRILLDCGLKMKEDGNTYAEVRRPQGINLTFLSHPHLDHCGALPYNCWKGLKSPIICTEVAREVSRVLLHDSWKIERAQEAKSAYSIGWVNRATNLMMALNKGDLGDVSYELIPSGHIPGAVSIYLRHQDKSLLYTGDINGVDTRLMPKAQAMPRAAVLIVDSTYGNRQHEDRRKVEKKFKDIVMRTVKRGGSIIIGAFATARIQEIMLLLNETETDYPIYLDGMAREITGIYLRNLKSLRDNSLLTAAGHIDWVDGSAKRKSIRKKPGIFLASSGMLNGGAISSYLAAFAHDKKSALILPGYQAANTNGRKVLDGEEIEIEGRRLKVKCGAYNLNFSSHSDAVVLEQTIREVSPQLVIAQHGDPEGVAGVVAIANKLGVKAIAPVKSEKVIL